MNCLSALVLILAVGLSQALLPFSIFGAQVKRSTDDTERRARASEEITRREVSKMVDRLAAVVSHAHQEAKKRDVPSVMESIFSPGAFRMAVESRKRDAEKSLNEKLDSIVNEIGAAADAAQTEAKKRRGVPSFGEALFGGFPFNRNNLKQRRGAQDIQQQVADVVKEINAAIGGQDEHESDTARRSAFDCAPVNAACHPFKHCCGDYVCHREGYSFSGVCA